MPALNFTLFEALILIFTPVFGLIPIRAFRLAILKVPKPTSCTGLPFLSRKFSIYDLYYYEFIIVGILMIGIFWWGCYPQILLNALLASPTLVIVCNSF